MTIRGPVRRHWMRLSLRARIMLVAVLAVSVTTLGMALTGSFLVKRTVHRQIAQEEFARVTSAAQQIDERFEARLRILNAVAQGMQLAKVKTPVEVQTYLDASPALRSAYDNIGVLNIQGTLVANGKPSAAVGRLDLHDRAYFVQTVASRQSVISEPI